MDDVGFVIVEVVSDDSSSENSNRNRNDDDSRSSSSSDSQLIVAIRGNQVRRQQRPLRLANDGISDSESDDSTLSVASLPNVAIFNPLLGNPQGNNPEDPEGNDDDIFDMHVNDPEDPQPNDDDIFAIHVNVPFAESTQHRASLVFVEDEGMVIVPTLRHIGNIKFVPPDGNCFYTSIIFGLFDLQVRPYYLEHGTPTQRLHHLSFIMHSIGVFRQNVKQYLLENMILFTSEDELIRSAHDSTGQRLRDYSTNEEVIRESIADRIYMEGVDFSNLRGTLFWADINMHLPVLALYLRVTIACYFCVGTNNDPNTTIAHFEGGEEGGEVTMHYLPHHYYTPPSRRCICLNYVEGNHFNYLRPHSYNGPDIDWDDFPPFDPDHDDSQCDEDDDESTVTSTPSIPPKRYRHDRSSTTNNLQRLSKTVCNRLARTNEVHQYEHFCHYSQDQENPKERWVHFKAVDEPKIVYLPKSELRDKIHVKVSNGKLTHVGFDPSFKSKGEYFRQLFADNTPDHIALRAQNSYLTQLGNLGSGKRGKYVVCFNGWCVQKNKGCPTKYNGGIPYNELLKLGNNESNDLIAVQMIIRNKCLKKSTGCLASLISTRWHQSIGVGRLASNEIQLASQKIDNKRRRRDAKSSEESSNDTVPNRGSKSIPSEMLWKQNTLGSVRTQQREYCRKVLQTIEVGNRVGEWDVNTTNMKAMWRTLSEYSNRNDLSFMGYHYFLQFMKGRQRKMLRREWKEIIDSFSKLFD